MDILTFEDVYEILSERRYRYWMDQKTPMVDNETVEFCLDKFYSFVSKLGITDPPTIRRVLTKLCKEQANGLNNAV